MLKLRNSKGFTFLEILVALGIMAFGFLAMSQMQYLSLRQKQLAETGTVATNMIQFIADRDMAEVKRVHMMNSIAFVEAQAGRLNPGDSNEPHLKYCKASTSGIIIVCDGCPCNPLIAITPTPAESEDPETTCAVISPHNFNPRDVEFKDKKEDCNVSNDGEMIVVKQVVTTIDAGPPVETTLNITYAVKTPIQFDKSDFDSMSLNDSLASQRYTITSHQEDWSEIISGNTWETVEIPHIP